MNETGPVGVRTVRGDAEVASLVLGDLSDFFNPFLRHFMREAIRCGGEVQIAPPEGAVEGLYLYHPVEREGSVFTRDRRIAEAFRPPVDEVAVYADFELTPGAEAFAIYAGAPGGRSLEHRFSHLVRLARVEDRTAILELMSAVYGGVDARWLEGPPASPEVAFVVESDRELAGVGWATALPDAGRLHSLTVRPTYRRTHVGTDLFHARIECLRTNGVRSVVAEIAERNLPSRRIAEGGGLSAVGRIFRSPRT